MRELHVEINTDIQVAHYWGDKAVTRILQLFTDHPTSACLDNVFGNRQKCLRRSEIGIRIMLHGPR